jgi:signal transduction histidine kinase
MAATMTPDTPPAPLPLTDFRAGLLRRALWTSATSVVIALVISTLQGRGLVESLIYSESIGLLCWALTDGGRLLVARALHRRRPHDPFLAHGWPGWGWMGGILLVASPLGYVLGSMVGAALTGSSPSPNHHDPAHALNGYLVMLLVTLGIGALLTRFQHLRGQLDHARAEAETVRRLAAETRLKLLESQLEPHMLFNTLANLRVLVDLDPPRAGVMLDHLVDFLRATLQGSRLTEHPLAAEFDRLRDYLALMGMRMGERLQVEFDLPAPLATLPVPTLLLQPLVENAIRHGLEPSIDGGRLRIVARREDDPVRGARLVLSVHDTGVGLPAAGVPSGGGFGLTQVRERLATRHGDAAALTLDTAADGGTVACIDLPCPTP